MESVQLNSRLFSFVGGDFMTLFDYAKADEVAFDDMLADLRATGEWKFIDREVDIRIEKS